MKTLKAISVFAFFVGIMLVAGAIGADDLAVQMHQAHTLDLSSMVIGMICCVPMVLFCGEK